MKQKVNKSSINELRQLIKSHVLKALQEAEKEEAPKEEEGGTEEENPFAAATKKGEEEEPTKEKGEGEEKKDDKKPEKKEEEEGLRIKFDVDSVKKYNDALFTNNRGIVKKITKDGLTVHVEPDDVDVFVNFNDITENAKKFFKTRR